MSRAESTLPGPSGPISLGRNDDGVALIRAGSRDDALRGLGYCHARDRGLQMLFVRILARGEGSRWLESSETMLAIDRYFRRVHFLADAATEYEALVPDARTAVDAYAAGANAYFGRHGLPWELRALGYHKAFEPWAFADSLLTGKTIGYVSLGATQGEMERWIVECVRAGVPAEALEELFPGQLGGLDVALIRGLRLGEPLVPAELWSVAGLPWAVASNSWVVDGSRSASGRPILCNDPHLEINRIPPIWYEAVLNWSDETGPRYAMGATMPGVPGVTLGRTDRVAWGITYSYMDCLDSWVEDCRDGHYRRADAWVPLRARSETVERKGKPPSTFTFFETAEHGTIDGDPAEPGLYLATRWSNGLNTVASSLGALVKVLGARTADQARADLSGLNNSAWVIVVADVDGSIGLQMTGLMPLRREGATGLVPLPGWDPANDWRGFAPPEDLPRALDPTDGLLVAANNDLNDLGRLRPINISVVPYRAARIRQVLEAHGGKLTVDDMAGLQRDVRSLQADRFLPTVLPLLDVRRDGPRAEMLRRWDRTYPAGSLGATLFERFYRALVDDVFGGRLGPGAVAHLRSGSVLLAEYYYVFDRVLLADRSSWFGGRTRSQVYRAALDVALAEDPTPYRPSPEPVAFRQILLGGKLPAFLGFDRGPYDLSGGRATVSQCQVVAVAGRQSAGCPSIRVVADLGEDVLHTSLPGGPSDRRSSPWYASGLDAYLAGTMKPLRGRP